MKIRVLKEFSGPFYELAGIRVIAYDGETGIIVRHYLNNENRQNSQIHVNMESGGLRVFLPKHIQPTGNRRDITDGDIVLGKIPGITNEDNHEQVD